MNESSTENIIVGHHVNTTKENPP